MKVPNENHNGHQSTQIQKHHQIINGKNNNSWTMSIPFLRPVPRTKWNPLGLSLRIRAFRRLLSVLCGLVLVSIILVSHNPSRNTILRGVWPRMWLDVSTWQVLKMRASTGSINVGTCTDVKCPAILYKPITTRKDVEQRTIDYYDSDMFTSKAADLDSWMWKFLPVMNRQEKITLLHTLDVMAEVLSHAGLSFFLVDGTLLGAVRNEGVIPWDDDIDVAVNGSEWRRVKQALCCVEGFKLIPKDFMHWKFFSTDGVIIRNWPMYHFPFVDLFFYTEDIDRIWALTPYNLHNLVFQKSDVFPLGRITLDGHQYPAPRRSEYLTKAQFGDLSKCVSPNMLHKHDHAIHGPDRLVVPCVKLKRMYPNMAKEDG